MNPPDSVPRFDIVAIGEAMVEFNQATGAGARTYLQGFGGDTSNLAIAAARQGARVAYVSALGADEEGRMLRALWQREGIDATHVRTDPVAPTGIYFVSHDGTGHHFSFRRAGSAASRLRGADLPLEVVRSARVLHLSGISLAISNEACDAAHAAMAAAREAGVLVSFDTNLRLALWPLERARAMILDALSRTDIALPSYDDAVAITGLTGPDAIVDRCLALGARVVALKLGSEGAIVADREQRTRIAPYPVKPVDATGAGDTFGGAFLVRWLAGDTIEEAGRYAAVAAALSTEGFGAVEPIPHAEMVRIAMESMRE